MSVCVLNSLHNSEYSNLLIVVSFSNSLSLVKHFSLVKNSFLPTFSDDKAEILAICLLNYIELCFALFCY